MHVVLSLFSRVLSRIAASLHIKLDFSAYLVHLHNYYLPAVDVSPHNVSSFLSIYRLCARTLPR